MAAKIEDPRLVSAAETGEILTFAGWVLELDGRRLTTTAGAVVHLTPTECRVLALLARNPNRTVDRDQLMAVVADRPWEPFVRSVDVHISNLRRKLDPDPMRPSLIRTVRGAGYMLVPGQN